MPDLFDRVPGAVREDRAEPRVLAEKKAAMGVCAVCEAPGPFGFDVFLRQNKTGRWACLAHRDVVRTGGPV